MNKAKNKAKKISSILVFMTFVASIITVLYFLNVYQQSLLPGEVIPSMGNEHIESSDSPHKAYNSDPPTSGPHTNYIASWGIYDKPIPKQILVHNLEDGGIVIYYNSEVIDSSKEKLIEIVKNYDDGVIMVPYPDMNNKITLTAWTRLDRLEGFDKERIVNFIDAFRGKDHHKR